MLRFYQLQRVPVATATQTSGRPAMATIPEYPNEEPQLVRFYDAGDASKSPDQLHHSSSRSTDHSSTLGGSGCISELENMIFSTLDSLSLEPVGPTAGALFCATQSCVPKSQTKIKHLEPYSLSFPQDQEQLVDPCLSGDSTRAAEQNLGQFETTVGGWMRVFAAENEGLRSESPLFVSVLPQESRSEDGQSVCCELCMRVYVLMPILLNPDGPGKSPHHGKAYCNSLLLWYCLCVCADILPAQTSRVPPTMICVSRHHCRWCSGTF